MLVELRLSCFLVILAIGEALVEFRRLTADGRLVVPGEWAGPFPSGAPAIFASVAARLGADAALAASVGADAFGELFASRMRRDGVVTDALRVVPDRSTAVAFVAYEDAGTRDFWFSVPDSVAVELDRTALGELSPRADWLHVCGSTLAFGGATAEAIETTARQLLRAGGRVSLDPNLRPSANPHALARTAALARVATVVFPSDGELEALGITERDLAERGALVCRTRGAEGATVSGGRHGLEPVDVSAPAVKEVDSTGAGDTFAAAFVTATRAGAEPVAAARAACAVAARTVGVLGAMELPLGPEDLERR
jgi:sugar/nucleoside kinase (ribokinase family)